MPSCATSGLPMTHWSRRTSRRCSRRSTSSLRRVRRMSVEPPRGFNFGPGNPDPGVFPSDALGEAARRVLARDGEELAHYPDPLGLPALRAVAAERFERNHGVRPPLEDVVITN